jgi:hypothetical protein
MPHRIPILQRPQSRLAALLSAGPSTRPTPSSTPVLEVFYPLYDEVEENKKWYNSVSPSFSFKFLYFDFSVR